MTRRAAPNKRHGARAPGVDPVVRSLIFGEFSVVRDFRPLKLNVDGDIAERLKIPQAAVRAVLAGHCSSERYLRQSSIEGAPRIDLDGAEAGTVTEIEARGAKVRFLRLLRGGRQ